MVKKPKEELEEAFRSADLEAKAKLLLAKEEAKERFNATITSAKAALNAALRQANEEYEKTLAPLKIKGAYHPIWEIPRMEDAEKIRNRAELIKKQKKKK